MAPAHLIAFLNALGVGDLEAIAAKLEEARVSCEEMSQPELAAKVADASRALRSADLKTYRKNLETVVSRLGHLK
jgi:hypothetical protein